MGRVGGGVEGGWRGVEGGGGRWREVVGGGGRWRWWEVEGVVSADFCRFFGID